MIIQLNLNFSQPYNFLGFVVLVSPVHFQKQTHVPNHFVQHFQLHHWPWLKLNGFHHQHNNLLATDVPTVLLYQLQRFGHQLKSLPFQLLYHQWHLL